MTKVKYIFLETSLEMENCVNVPGESGTHEISLFVNVTVA